MKLVKLWDFFWWWLLYHGDESPIRLWRESKEIEEKLNKYRSG